MFSAEVDSMPLTLVNTLVLFEKALCNASADVSVDAGRFQYEFVTIRTCNDIRLIGQDCSTYLFPINYLFVVDFDFISVGHQILNLS